MALFCNVRFDCVIQSIDVETIYDVPIKMMDEGLDKVTLEKFNIKESSLILINGKISSIN
ncbi:MAG: hypothetical protein CM15mP102_12100 [Flavobacteriales bacterium]|nr:MAG: hypothetical protein CM15mP102_12100 [Flavobacteriales bacterium]